ncbi:MAG: hypothetical protein J6K64_02970 [Clostridia bacterium]|nr:hypothetical protein [Clostridia bacterium]
MPEKIKSSKVAAFLNTTPKAESATWSRMGKGISSLPISYGAKTTSETYIDEDNATTTVDGYDIGTDTEQVAMKGEPVFDYVDGLRKNLATGSDCETTIILAEIYDLTLEEGKYTGLVRVFGATIVITDYELSGGEVVKIKYKVSFNGTPEKKNAEISADGTISFAEA